MSRLTRELSQHEYLRQRLQAEFPDVDDETLQDTLEGLTSLSDMIASVLRSQLEDLALVQGLKHRIGEMQQRLARLERRADRKRQLAISVMERAAIRNIIEPDFTASLRRGPAPLLLVDEGSIPENF